MKESIEAFMNDDLFFHWLIEPTGELDEYWAEKTKEMPDIRQNITQIRSILNRIRVHETELSEREKIQLWEKVEKECYSRKQFFLHRYKLGMVAALIGVIFLTGLGYTIFKKNHQQEEKREIDYLTLANQFEWDKEEENVRLIISENKEIELKDDNVDLVYGDNNEVNINSEKVDLDEPTQTTDNLLKFNQLIVPYGKFSSVVLRDGTKIWVNSGSRIIYPTVFDDNKREIFVIGEIYLEVAKDPKRPFIVKTSLFDVNVLGTSFNVHAYKEDSLQSVVLATGSLQVKNKDANNSSKIVPNQMYLYESGKRKTIIEDVDIYDHICWKYGFLHFQSEKLSSVLLRLQRYYNIYMDYDEKKMGNVLVSGKLDLKKDIESVFESISVTAPIQYRIKKDSVKINVK